MPTANDTASVTSHDGEEGEYEGGEGIFILKEISLFVASFPECGPLHRPPGRWPGGRFPCADFRITYKTGGCYNAFIMADTYIIFFDNKRQEKTASTRNQAVAGLFGFLEEATRAWFVGFPSANAWIVCNEPDQAKFTSDLKNCSKTHAEWLLDVYDKVELYAESMNLGVFASAAAFSAKELERTMQPAETMTRIAATEKAEQIIVRMLSHDDDAIADAWQPGEIDPIKILQAAEVRIFAFNLHQVLNKTPLGMEAVDRMCGFTPGTTLKMIHAVDPLRPTSKMVDKLARNLRVEPTNLWIDLVSMYLEKTGKWAEYTETGDGRYTHPSRC